MPFSKVMAVVHIGLDERDTMAGVFDDEAAARQAIIDYINDTPLVEDEPIRDWDDLQARDNLSELFSHKVVPIQPGQFHLITED